MMISMRLNYKLLLTLGLSFAFLGCEPEIDNVSTPDKGTADFTTYVALGNSLTAGYADFALYRESQMNSYPAILAKQFQKVGGGEFAQPLVPVGNGSNESGQGKLVLQIVNGEPTPVPTQAGSGVFNKVNGSFNNLGIPGAKAGHLVAPGYGSDEGNPFFARFASSPNTTVVEDAMQRNPTFFTLWIGNNDVLGYATSGGAGDAITDLGEFNAAIDAIIAGLKGGNANIKGAIANIPDVTKIPYFTRVPWNGLDLNADQAAQANMAYQASIVDAPGKLGDQVKVGVVTTVATTTAVAGEVIFQQAYQEAIGNGATEAQAEIAAGQFVMSEAGMTAINVLRDVLLGDNLPAELAPAKEQINYLIANPEARPAALTMAIEGLLGADTLPDELAAAVEAEKENQIAQLKAAGFYPIFVEGPNAFVIEDDNPNNPLGIRQMREGELVLLSALAGGQLLPETAAQPKPDQYILDASELEAIETARAAFNNKLKSKADAEEFAFVDVAGFLIEVSSNPLFIDGKEYSDEFVLGNIFSLDGIHLTQAGAAIVANKFIEAINSKYNAAVPPVVNINEYPTVPLP